MGKLLTYNAKIVERHDHTPELSTFVTEYDTPLGNAAHFTPGQYVAIGLNNTMAPERGSVRRAMSIASAPEQGDRLEFYVRFVSHPASDNPLTHLLWRAQVGDPIFVTRKPVGKFTVKDTLGTENRIKVFVAAGTGIAPFISMIRSHRLADPNRQLDDIILLHGASYPADLCYSEELERAAAEAGLHYFSTVSRPTQAPDWKGFAGRVEDFFLPERLLALEQVCGLERGHLSPETSGVLICGLQGTIAQTIQRLAARRFVPHDRKIRSALGLPPSLAPSVWWEQYDSEPVLDLSDSALLAKLRAQITAPQPAPAQ